MVNCFMLLLHGFRCFNYWPGFFFGEVSVMTRYPYKQNLCMDCLEPIKEDNTCGCNRKGFVGGTNRSENDG